MMCFEVSQLLTDTTISSVFERRDSQETLSLKELESLSSTMVERVLSSPEPSQLKMDVDSSCQKFYDVPKIRAINMEYICSKDLPMGKTFVLYKGRQHLLVEQYEFFPDDINQKPVAIFNCPKNEFKLRRAKAKSRKVTYRRGIYYLYEYRVALPTTHSMVLDT